MGTGLAPVPFTLPPDKESAMDKTKTKTKDETVSEQTKIGPVPASPVTGNADTVPDDDQPPVGRRKDNETDTNRPGDGARDRAEQGL